MKSNAQQVNPETSPHDDHERQLASNHDTRAWHSPGYGALDFVDDPGQHSGLVDLEFGKLG